MQGLALPRSHDEQMNDVLGSTHVRKRNVRTAQPFDVAPRDVTPRIVPPIERAQFHAQQGRLQLVEAAVAPAGLLDPIFR